MIHCKEEMFEPYLKSSELKNKDKKLEDIKRRLCPDHEALGQNYRVKGGYESEERTSFSVQAVRCNQDVDSSCAPKEDV